MQSQIGVIIFLIWTDLYLKEEEMMQIMSNVIQDLNLEPKLYFLALQNRTIQTYQRLKKYFKFQ